jgi:hypothetical protein
VTAIVATPAGRLITFRVSSPVQDANAQLAATELRAAVASIPGRIVVCTDLTDARVFAPGATTTFIQTMRADNAKLERSAILLGSKSATFLLQLERMVREANHPARRTFRDAEELAGWLALVLSAAEQKALHAFLANAQLVSI